MTREYNLWVFSKLQEYARDTKAALNPPSETRADVGNQIPSFLATDTATIREDELAPSLAADESTASQPSKLITVLLVDDVMLTLQNLSKLLSFEPDIQVLGTATNGKEGIEQARKFAPNIVVMGINMPVMDGITATQRLSDELPTTRGIVMSVQSEPDYLQRAFQAGAFDYLTKPFSGDELVTSIRFVWDVAKDEELKVFRAASATCDGPTVANSGSSFLNARLAAWRTLVQMRYSSAWAGAAWADPQLLERANGTGIDDLVGSARLAKEAESRAKEASRTAKEAWQIARRVVDGIIDPATIYEQYVTAPEAHRTAKSAAQQAREALAKLETEIAAAVGSRAAAPATKSRNGNPTEWTMTENQIPKVGNAALPRSGQKHSLSGKQAHRDGAVDFLGAIFPLAVNCAEAILKHASETGSKIARRDPIRLKCMIVLEVEYLTLHVIDREAFALLGVQKRAPVMDFIIRSNLDSTIDAMLTPKSPNDRAAAAQDLARLKATALAEYSERALEYSAFRELLGGSGETLLLHFAKRMADACEINIRNDVSFLVPVSLLMAGAVAALNIRESLARAKAA